MRMASATKPGSRSLLRAYQAAMCEYVKKPREAGLERAYELGRRALEQGAAMVDVAGIYHHALVAVLQRTKEPLECVRKTRVAGNFFVESLSPFEMTYRGHHEAQAALRQLNEGMEAEAKRIAHQRSGIEVVVQGSTPERLSPLVETALYRSVQEALTNVTKHAKASNVTVQVQRQKSEKDAMVVCSVKDDGVGFEIQPLSGEQPRHGLGLLGIRERIKAVAGSLELKSAPGLGTELCIQVPLNT